MVVFIDKGDGSAGISNSSQQLLTFLELLEAIALKLQSVGNPSDRVQGIDDGAEQLLTPEEEALTNQGIALAAMDLLTLDGVERETEGMGVQSVYASDKYVISSQLDDPAGMPIYTVRAVELDADVLSFQEDPQNKGEFHFFVCEESMTAEMQLDFVRGYTQSQRYQLEQGESFQDLSGTEKVSTILNTYGESLAPKGAKAIYVANHLLSNESDVKNKGNGDLLLEGERFNFLKTSKGQIGIFEKKDGEIPCLICGMDASGQIKDYELTTETNEQIHLLFGQIRVMEMDKAMSDNILVADRDGGDESWLEGFGVPTLDLER